ncbi:hypothetical protein JCM17960_02670 [Magnetospira thiophila]
MIRELLILRHGKAENVSRDKDFERPINEMGKRDVQRMGVWMARQALVADYVICSPAKRALETARKACKAMGLGDEGIVADPRLYKASMGNMLKLLGEIPPVARRVLLVGHNPDLENLLAHLSGKSGTGLGMADLAVLNMPEDWQSLQSGVGHLLSITKAKDLPKKFPFPGPNGTELRDRPAYYYTQSGVIPYRLRKGKIEILVVRSSSQKHWVVPKGIKEPGMTAQASAALEAREEAGVLGIVRDEALGHYSYEKWGANCTCEVFAMEVTRVLPKKDWEEIHRGRVWLSPKQAASKLKQSDLRPMIESLVAMLTETSK